MGAYGCIQMRDGCMMMHPDGKDTRVEEVALFALSLAAQYSIVQKDNKYLVILLGELGKQ